MAQPGAQLPVRPVRTFAPDADSLTPGVVVDGNDLYPTMAGMRTLGGLAQLTDPLSEPSVGLAVFQFPDGFQVTVAGTATTLNSVLSFPPDIFTPWVTQPIDAGGPVQRWRFAFYKDGTGAPAIIAVNGMTTPLVATESSLGTPTPWGTLSTDPVTPIASLVAASDYALFLVRANSQDWFASSNSTIWTPNPATLTVNSSLRQTSGPITAALALRSNMVLYKERSVFVGSLVGPPLIWSFSKISSQVGTPAQESLIAVRDIHYFLGPDDFYTFDGFSLAPIPNALKQWFFGRWLNNSAVPPHARYDEIRSLIVWHFESIATPGVLGEWIALNIRTQQWSHGTKIVENAAQSPIRRRPQVSSAFVAGAEPGLTPHTVYAYEPDGVGGISGFATSGDLGDRHAMWQLTRVRPQYARLNGVPKCTPLTKYVSGGTYNKATQVFQDDDAAAYVPGTPVLLSPDGWFNLNISQRLVRLRFDHDADCEMIGFEPDMKPAGDV